MKTTENTENAMKKALANCTSTQKAAETLLAAWRAANVDTDEQWSLCQTVADEAALAGSEDADVLQELADTIDMLDEESDSEDEE